MATFRIERLNREFLRDMADIVANRLKDERLRDAMLTGVECSRDLSHAKVYFTVLDYSSAEGVKSALDSCAGRIRGFLGRDMRVRQVPELRFVFDDSERKAREIDALIDRVMKEDSFGKSQ
ncbi:MAG: 30S ribosome-binding factor RbfA [Synergistaceae bacterium]|jgi:ribosome-binding factor A|nr:30S ribosome-binding factor RbfA [Synergistaceae bacterium]